MSNNFLSKLLRSIGRVPEEDLDEIRKKREEREKREERRYIKLMGENNDCEIEELTDEFFEDDDEDEVPIRTPEEEKRDKLIGDVYFFSAVLLVGAVFFGFIALIARLIAFPIMKKISDDLDW